MLNGNAVTAEPDEETSLLELLREQLGVRSVKDGCAPEGSCGACTVMVDGRAVVSCAQKARRFEGKHVVTHEGLSDEDRRRWSESFVAAGASQCGYCSPGIVMKAEALLHKNSEPSREEIAHALLGNLCRCTGYVKVIDAIELAAAARRGEPLPEPDRSGRVGSRTARYRGTELALGDQVFVGDMTRPGLLHGALRFSDHPRARVLRIDTSLALAAPGVVAVVTAADVTGDRVQGSIKRDWRQFVAEGEVTSYVGDVIAAVAAETHQAARAAAALVDVEYEVLDPVTDPFAALAEGAPELHEGGNVLSVSRVQRGDVDAALAGAAHVVSETFRTQFIEHAFLEPESSLAVPDGDGPLEIYSQGQGVWDDRRQIASFLGLPEERVRVTHVPTGGAFGAKEDLNVQCHAALLATRTSRPTLVTLTRKESLRFHAKRHAMWLDYTVGCDEEGRLVGVRARIVGDTGAYASVGDKVLERAAGHACGAYAVENVDVEGTAVYTNNLPCGAMRGFGVNQSNFAIEGVLDMLAERVGIDGWEIRWRNALEEGTRFGTGQKLGPGVGLKKTLLAVKDAYRGARYAGIACGVKNTGIGNGMTEYGRAVLRVEEDGAVSLFHSWTEMGQGVHTILQQIACEELGLPPERVRVAVDTDRDLETGQTTASRSTVLGGRAVIDAAQKLKAALVGRAARGPRGTGVPRRLRRRLDDEARAGRRRARHASRLRLGDAGRDPRRRGPAGEGRRRARRRPDDQPDARGRPGRGRGAHGARAGALGGVRRRGLRAGHPDSEVTPHHPAQRDARGRGDLRRGAPAGRPLRRKGDRGGRARPDRRRGRGRAPFLRRHPPYPTADEGVTGRARRRAAPRAPRPRRRAPMILAGATVVTSLDPVRVTRATCTSWTGGSPRAGGGTRRDCSGCLVIPGNACAHTHLYSALARGMPYALEPPRNFTQILQRIWWRLDRALNEESIRASALVGGMEALLSGTTTLVDHHASPNAIDGSLDVVEEALRSLGVRCVLCYETSDRDGPERALAGVAENRRFLERVRREQLPLARGMVGAHASFTLSDETLAACCEAAGHYGVGLHVHAAEDGADERDAIARCGHRVADRLHRAGALDERTLLAHGVHLDDDEIALVRGAHASVAHNARSNMNNSIGRARLGVLGERVPLGTDGIGSDMFEESRAAFFRLREDDGGTAGDWPLRHLAESARLAGRAFDEPLLGTLQEGAPADLVVLDYPAPTPVHDASFAGHWVFGLSTRNVRDVMVAGEWAVLDRRLTRVDQQELAARALADAERLWQRLDGIGAHTFEPKGGQ